MSEPKKEEQLPQTESVAETETTENTQGEAAAKTETATKSKIIRTDGKEKLPVKVAANPQTSKVKSKSTKGKFIRTDY